MRRVFARMQRSCHIQSPVLDVVHSPLTLKSLLLQNEIRVRVDWADRFAGVIGEALAKGQKRTR